MKKHSEKTAQTKAALTTAFWELYKAKPITKITIKDITDRAGYYRSTFYFYFTDIYAILEQIENDILKNWELMVCEVLEQGKQEMMLGMVTAFYERNGEYMSVLLSPNGDPTFQQKIKDAMRPKMFSQYKSSDKDAKMIMIFEFLVSGMLAFITEWYRNAKHISAEDAVKLLQSLASENIASVMLRHAAGVSK